MENVFTPLETQRLLIRAAEAGDVADLHARRNDPAVAETQSWALPYPMEDAETIIEALVAMDGPANDEWWMAIVTLKESGETIGDLVVHLSSEGRVAEIGYTFASIHWGHGYAAEATEAFVDWLFGEMEVKRIVGRLRPDNVASAQVLERNGFLYEGHTRMSHWKGDEGSDDWIYGLLPEDREAWKSRKRHRPDSIEFVEVDHSNEGDVYKVKTHWSQRAFVAPMEWSFTDALFPEIHNGAPMVPWLRAVEAEGELVGFVMIAWVTETEPEPYLWRLLVDRLHQRRGIGSMILDKLEDMCRAEGWEALKTSWGEGRGSPRPFYEGRGFVPTGEIDDDETVARKQL